MNYNKKDSKLLQKVNQNASESKVVHQVICEPLFQWQATLFVTNEDIEKKEISSFEIEPPGGVLKDISPSIC